MVGETARLREASDAALGELRYNDYANGLYAHVWRVFCDWYLEFAKPLLSRRRRGGAGGNARHHRLGAGSDPAADASGDARS